MLILFLYELFKIFIVLFSVFFLLLVHFLYFADLLSMFQYLIAADLFVFSKCFVSWLVYIFLLKSHFEFCIWCNPKNVISISFATCIKSISTVSSNYSKSVPLITVVFPLRALDPSFFHFTTFQSFLPFQTDVLISLGLKWSPSLLLSCGVSKWQAITAFFNWDF